MRHGWLLWAVVLGVSAVIGVALHDEQREFEAALVNLTQQQQLLALLLSDELSARLSAVQRDARIVAEDIASGREPSAAVRSAYPRLQILSAANAAAAPLEAPMLSVRTPSTEGRLVELTIPVAWLIGPSKRIETPNELVVLVKSPKDTQWQTPDGRRITSDVLTKALDAGDRSVRLEREQAAALGLPPRRAVAGIEVTDEGALGSWVTAVIASASNERDRWDRARGRILLGVLIPCSLIVAFGFVAMRRQQRQLALESALEMADLQQQSDASLARASRVAMTGTLAMGIAHEISTPLGIIAARAEQLDAAANTTPKMARAIRSIREQTTQISQIVRGFLDLARGGFPPLRPIPAANVAHGAQRLVEHRFLAAKITLTTSVEDNLPMLVCEIRLLEHAIVNLLLNACEASSAGGQVDLIVHQRNNQIEFVVDDNGVGIGVENIARATEPFFTTKPEGSGLGLAIVNEIVNIHRGTLVLEQRATGGTRACIRLPRQEMDNEHV